MDRDQVISGAAFGLLLSFVAATVLLLGLDTTLGYSPWLTALPFLLPALGVLLLLLPPWRRAGAGFLMGLSVGGIVFAGVCGAFLGVDQIGRM